MDIDFIANLVRTLVAELDEPRTIEDLVAAVSL